MKRTSIILSAIVLSAGIGVVEAQERRASFDNFSTGITVFTPPKPAAKPTIKPAKTTAKNNSKKNAQKQPLPMPPVQKTVQQQRTSGVQDSLALADMRGNSSNIKLTSSANRSMHGFTTGNAAIDSYIVTSSARYGLDPLLIYAQMHQESAFKAKALSHKGASGYMQLMPATARRFGVTNIWDAQQNIDAGVKYMRWLLDKFNGDMTLALAGYNAGEGAVMKYGWNVPPYNETREYVRRISARYETIRNPNAPRMAARVTNSTLAKLDKKEATPLNIYEKAVYTVKMPDGRIRLVSQ